ncbi:hypothetical protein B0H13DRAFT_2372841 [Mycena leptocephala]|nr:hypothetical protein B0H13DRAFT_2372841 [Mycena leptocephala]
MSSIPAHWLLKTATDDSEDERRLQSSDLPSSSPNMEQSTNPLKRHGEDLGQYAEHVSRRLRLTPGAHEELKHFSQLTGPQQSVWIAARMLEGNYQVSMLVPAEAMYNIPTAFEGHIDMSCFLALVDPTAFSYVHKSTLHGPIARVLNHLAKDPSWGFTAEVRADKAKLKVIKGRVGLKLTSFRNVIKSAIGDSVGHTRETTEFLLPGEPTRNDTQDILTLCQRILSLGAKVAPDVKLSMEMAARMAYVRHIYQGKLDKKSKKQAEVKEPEADAEADKDDEKVSKFWASVDSGLAEVRQVAKGVEEDMSRLFSKSLADDLALYGKVKLDHLTAVAPHTPD